MKNERKQFATALTALINKSGQQQKDIAAELEISPTTLNNWCRGVSEPSIENIHKLADYFAVDTNELLGKSVPEADLTLTLEGTKTIILLEKMQASQQKALYQYAKLLFDSGKY